MTTLDNMLVELENVKKQLIELETNLSDCACFINRKYTQGLIRKDVTLNRDIISYLLCDRVHCTHCDQLKILTETFNILANQVHSEISKEFNLNDITNPFIL